MKTKRVYVNLPEFDRNQDGSRKVWRTDGIPTHCASFDVSYFVWEKNTRHNNYEGYSGYFSPSIIEEVA